MTEEDARQLREHEEGAKAYDMEWRACLSLAFSGSGRDFGDSPWGPVAWVIGCFFANNPDAPPAAALMEVKLRLKQALLPHDDPRRVALALSLFRAFVLGLAAIEAEDGAAAKAAFEAQRPQTWGTARDLAGTPYELAPSPFTDVSDLGRRFPPASPATKA